MDPTIEELMARWIRAFDIRFHGADVDATTFAYLFHAYIGATAHAIVPTKPGDETLERAARAVHAHLKPDEPFEMPAAVLMRQQCRGTALAIYGVFLPERRQASQGDGVAIVPIEPDSERLERGARAIFADTFSDLESYDTPKGGEFCKDACRDAARRAWTAMVHDGAPS